MDKKLPSRITSTSSAMTKIRRSVCFLLCFDREDYVLMFCTAQCLFCMMAGLRRPAGRSS